MEYIVIFALGFWLYGKFSSVNKRFEKLEIAQQRAEAELFALRARRSGPAGEASVSAAPVTPEPGPAADGVIDAEPAQPETPIAQSVPPIEPVSTPEAVTAGASVPPVPPISPPAAGTPPGSGAAKPVYGSFEERLGTRWTVWVGGVALALGGIFLVKYSIDAGLIGPGVRVILGALLALVLAAAGEWARRNEIPGAITAVPAAHIPSVLTAAATVVAFATVFSAYALYGFIGPTLAFLLLAAVGLVSMLAAAVHGPAVAGVGLLGSYATPLLVTSQQPNPWPAVLFLAAISASAYALARLRHWRWLAISAVAGSALWGILLLVPTAVDVASNYSPLSAYDLSQIAIAALFLGFLSHIGSGDEDAHVDLTATISLLVLTLVLTMALFLDPAGLNERMVLATAAIGILTLTGWYVPAVGGAVALAGLTAVALLTAWPDWVAAPIASPEAAGLAPTVSGEAKTSGIWFLVPQDPGSYIGYAVAATLVPAILATVRVWAAPSFRVPITAMYMLGATVPPLVALVLAYLRVGQFEISIPFALMAVSLSALFAIGADQFHDEHDDAKSASYNTASGTLAAASIAALCLALTASLDRGYLTVAFALAALGTAYVSTIRNIPILRYAVTVLGVIVLARVVWDPRIMGADVGTLPVFNWLLAGYGIPAAAFGLSAWLLRWRGEDTAVRLSESLALLFVALLAFFEIRHFVNNGDVLHTASGHLEQGLIALVALGLSLATARMNAAARNPVFDVASIIFAFFALLFASTGLGFAQNPLFAAEMVKGSVLLNSLTAAYLLPGVAALFVARHTRGLRPEWYIKSLTVLGVFLIFLFVTANVRFAFVGANISLGNEPGGAENWAISVAWLLLGLVFLAYGIARQSKEARLASAALVTLASLKVGIVDLAGLSGLWRALSFMCLGAVLIGIGMVYQKLIFSKPAEEQAAG